MEESSAGERSAVMLLIEEPVEATASILEDSTCIYHNGIHVKTSRSKQTHLSLEDSTCVYHHGIHIKTSSQEHLVLAI